jgi:hypothetical protein
MSLQQLIIEEFSQWVYMLRNDFPLLRIDFFLPIKKMATA